MTYEEALNAYNTDPFSDTYAWCYHNRVEGQAAGTHYLYVVPVASPGLFLSIGIAADKATLPQLEASLRDALYVDDVTLPDAIRASQWFAGTPAELLQHVKQRSKQHDV